MRVSQKAPPVMISEFIVLYLFTFLTIDYRYLRICVFGAGKFYIMTMAYGAVATANAWNLLLSAVK